MRPFPNEAGDEATRSPPEVPATIAIDQTEDHHMISTATETRLEAVAGSTTVAAGSTAPRIVMTRACLGALSNGTLASEAVARAHVLQALRRYTFPADCPERDRGQFELSGETIHFRIDYYDVALEWGSEDPADASITRRVLTLMLREDL